MPENSKVLSRPFSDHFLREIWFSFELHTSGIGEGDVQATKRPQSLLQIPPILNKNLLRLYPWNLKFMNL